MTFLEFLKNLILDMFKPVQTPTPISVPPNPKPLPEVIPLSPREILYKTALSFLGTDASPNDLAPDDLACAETVNEIHKKAFGIHIDEPGLSTTSLYAAMKHLTSMFQSVPDPLPGDIIISPTGYGNGNLAHGHVGIMSKYRIFSNNSATGNLTEYYTLETWRDRYQKLGGFPVLFFRRV